MHFRQISVYSTAYDRDGANPSIGGITLTRAISTEYFVIESVEIEHQCSESVKHQTGVFGCKDRCSRVPDLLFVAPRASKAKSRSANQQLRPPYRNEFVLKICQNSVSAIREVDLMKALELLVGENCSGPRLSFPANPADT